MKHKSKLTKSHHPDACRLSTLVTAPVFATSARTFFLQMCVIMQIELSTCVLLGTFIFFPSRTLMANIM